MFKELLKHPSISVAVTLLAIQAFYTVKISKTPESVRLSLHLILLDQAPYSSY